LDEAKREIHEGCTTSTRLAFIMKLLHIKTYNQVTNKAFDLFLSLLCVAFPWVDFPKSYADAKSVLSEVGLGYETIYLCKFDCALYWGDHENNTLSCVWFSRWRDTNGIKKVPHKVLRYFPIIPRLQRFFVSTELSKHTRWHKDKRIVEEGVLRHPTNGKACKHFDEKFGWFSNDRGNIRLGIATYGFNPYGLFMTTQGMLPCLAVAPEDFWIFCLCAL
jgi:hypothetical protein